MLRCRSCGKKASRPYQLCTRCYCNARIRSEGKTREELEERVFQLQVTWLRRQPRGKNGEVVVEPTKAPPGTEAKLRVMSERAALGVDLFHPLDAGMGAFLTTMSS